MGRIAEDCQVYKAYFENGERSDREKWMSMSVANTHYHSIDVDLIVAINARYE